MTSGVVLALDVGGTQLKAAISGAGGALTNLVRRPTSAAEGGDAVLQRLVMLLRELRETAEASGRGIPLAAGVAVPGLVDERGGVVRFTANLPWRHRPLASQLEAALGVPVVLCHDVRAAGLAESRFGAARDVSDFCFVALGTGIAAAIVGGGHPVLGAHGQSGELGHIVVDPTGERCGCGATGCLETVASAAAIVRRYGRRRPEAAGTSAEEVLERAEAGDEAAREVRDAAIGALAGALATFQLVIDAELIVLGGGLSLAGSRLLEPLRDELSQRCTLAAVPRLELAQLGADAGCIGAGLAAWDELERRSGDGKTASTGLA